MSPAPPSSPSPSRSSPALALPVIACGGPEQEGADGEAITYQPASELTYQPVNPLLSPCYTDAADLSFFAGANSPQHQTLIADTGVYASGCKSLLADVTVGAGWDGYYYSVNELGVWFKPAEDMTSQNCSSVHFKFQVLKTRRKVSTGEVISFEVFDSYDHDGVWAQDPDAGSWCKIGASKIGNHAGTRMLSFEAISPPTGYRDTYRVIGTVTKNGVLVAPEVMIGEVY